MIRRFPLSIFLLFCVSLLAYGQDRMPGGESLQSEKLKLKNFAFCLCLREAKPDSTFWVNEGSASAYFERSEFDFEVVESIQSLISQKLQEDYPSKNNLDLSLMKCLDLYHSRELDSLSSK